MVFGNLQAFEKTKSWDESFIGAAQYTRKWKSMPSNKWKRLILFCTFFFLNYFFLGILTQINNHEIRFCLWKNSATSRGKQKYGTFFVLAIISINCCKMAHSKKYMKLFFDAKCLTHLNGSSTKKKYEIDFEVPGWPPGFFLPGGVSTFSWMSHPRKSWIYVNVFSTKLVYIFVLHNRGSGRFPT